MKTRLYSAEIKEEGDKETLLLGVESTEQTQAFAREKLGEVVEMRHPLNRDHVLFLWEKDDFKGLLTYLGLQ